MYEPHVDKDYFCGLDIARYGTDETVFVVLEVTAEGEGRVVYVEATSKKPITDTVGRLINLHQHFNFRMVYADETGLGGGAVDMIKEKGIPINPVTFTVQMKEKMYKNLKLKMEQGKLKIKVNNPKLLNQLSFLQYEYTSAGHLKIYAPQGGHDDYPDALALACLALLGEPLGGVFIMNEETLKKWNEYMR